MMDQERWEKLKEAFSKEDDFDEKGYYMANNGYPPFDLMDWLECNSTSPSWKMMDEFNSRGYSVFAGERDSFGWLTGIVKDRTTGRKIVFG